MVIAALPKNPELRQKIEEVDALAERLLGGAPGALSHEAFVEIDLKLNEVFLQATENRIFREVFTLVSNRSMRIRTFVEAMPKIRGSSLMQEITREHRAITQAILRQDREEAQKRVREHLANAEYRTLQEMKSYLENLRILEQSRASGGK